MQDRFKFRAWDKNIKQMRSVYGLSLLGPICADLKTEKSRINWNDCNRECWAHPRNKYYLNWLKQEAE